MTIYLDYLFIENVIFDFIILKEVSAVSKTNCKNKNLIIASTVSALYVVMMLVLKLQVLNYCITKILLAFVTIYIAFKPNKATTYFKLAIMFFLVSIVNIGILIVLKSLLGIDKLSGIIKIAIYVFVYLVGRFILFRIWKMYSLDITTESLNYMVTLKIGENKYVYDGFLDTGNTVYSHGMPIIFAEVLDQNMLSDLKDKEYFETKTVTLGSVTIKKAYIFDNIIVSNHKESHCVKAGVVFENNKMSRWSNYNMILNYILYTEAMGGIKI